MSISTEDVKKIASLARLRFSPDEIERYRSQLATILAYMDKLNELETKEVEPTNHVLDLVNVFREDKLEANLTPDEATANAPDPMKGHFAVPKVIDQDQDAS